MQTVYNVHSKLQYQALPGAYLNDNLFLFNEFQPLAIVQHCTANMLEAHYLRIKISTNSGYLLAHLQPTACMQKHSQAAFIWLSLCPEICRVCHAAFPYQIVQFTVDFPFVKLFLKNVSIYLRLEGSIFGAPFPQKIQLGETELL